MSNKASHTGIRNEQLFCFHCGTSQAIPYPMPVQFAADFFKLFDNHHTDCTKTWVEPANEVNNKTEQENAKWWLLHGERGVSSETMFKYLSDSVAHYPRYEGTPCDPDDFRRCHLLLEAVPQFRGKLDRMRPVGPVWVKLVENWDELTRLLKEQMETRKPNGMYELMESLGC